MFLVRPVLDRYQSLVLPAQCVGLQFPWPSTSSGNVYVPANEGSRSVSGYISSMCGASVSSASTLVILSSTIERYLRPMKSRSLGCPWPSVLACENMVSGIEIASQLHLTTFFIDPKVINLNPYFLFPLGPMQIVPLVRVIVLLQGVSYSCIWKYCQKGIAIYLLYFRVSPVIISLGLIFVKIPAVVGKYPKSFTLFITILTVKITGNLMKGRLCLVALYLYFTT